MASWRVQDRWWLRGDRGEPLAIFLLAGLLITGALEWLNVYVWRRWTYAPAMPLVLGIGLTPLLQWLLVPCLTVWLARRHLSLATRQQA
ncbi:MAG: hypothetical protein ABIY46_03555 [Gemmatimonadales bacterium]